jgi:hypothetical protein
METFSNVTEGSTLEKKKVHKENKSGLQRGQQKFTRSAGMAALMAQEVLESAESVAAGAGSEGMQMVVPEQASPLQDTAEGVENFSEAKSTFDEIEVVCSGRTDDDHGSSNGDEDLVNINPEVDVLPEYGEKAVVVSAVTAKEITELSQEGVDVTRCPPEDDDDDAKTTSQGAAGRRKKKKKSQELAVVEEIIKRLEVCEGITEDISQQETVNSSQEGSSFDRNPRASPTSRFDNGLETTQEQQQLLQEKVNSLERELNIKCSELDSVKQTFEERQHEFLYKIECLELANQQLLDGGADSCSVQLQMELSRLQRQNSTLSMRERELQFQLSTQEMMNEQLKDSSTSPNDNKTAEAAKTQLEARIAALKLELAEAVEVNNMYKVQLHDAFAKQKHVHAAALQNSGNVEDVVKELLRLRQRTKAQEDELQDLQDRFFLISVRLAESVAQREELMMKVKRIQHLKH